jgi:mannitol-1-phosphate/altronate dehydrogenase
MVTSVTKGGTQKMPKEFRLSKPTDMTIHWKALEEHFLMVALIFRFNQFRGENVFSQEASVLEELNIMFYPCQRFSTGNTLEEYNP